MKNMHDILDTFTEYEWKQAKREMAKRIPSMKIDKMTMEEFKTLTKYLATTNLDNIDDYRRMLH